MNSPTMEVRKGRKKAAGQAGSTGAAPSAVAGVNLSRQEIVFTYDNQNAKEVFLAGNFTDWEKAPMKMTKGSEGRWQARVHLAPGRYHYKFLVDGEWRHDPTAREQSQNPFGTADSVIKVS